MSAVREEVVCAVCMDIMVNPCSVTECGHCFCIECINNIQACPSCRAAIQRRRRVVTSMDSLIWNIVISGAYDFEPDDIKAYLKRHHKRTSTLSQEKIRELCLKRSSKETSSETQPNVAKKRQRADPPAACPSASMSSEASEEEPEAGYGDLQPAPGAEVVDLYSADSDEDDEGDDEGGTHEDDDGGGAAHEEDNDDGAQVEDGAHEEENDEEEQNEAALDGMDNNPFGVFWGGDGISSDLPIVID